MSNDEFRRAFKYYKSRKPPPDLSLPIDLLEAKDLSKVTKLIPNENITLNWAKYGLKPPQQWDAYTINRNKGLIFINNPFYNIGQRYWIARCLRDYPKKPNKTNIDAHFNPADIEDWWITCNQDSEKGDNLKKSLRWVTLGYHHDWDSKHYSDENKHSFPSDLSELCKMIVSCFDFEEYIPQALIVNYYHMDSTLAPHTDHSEKNLDAPLISISFGQSAIFLIGESKSEEPSALYIHSGDIIIMSKESRLCYHAVPRIVKAKVEPWSNVENLKENNWDADEEILISDDYNNCTYWKPFEDYLIDSRINMNIRQVLFKDQNSLNDIVS